MMRWLVLVFLMMSFVSAVDIDFDCPDEIFVDEEFECVLEVFDGDGEYDVKVDLDGERDSVVKVWNDGEWKSGYYYLTDFIEDGDDEKIRMKVSDDGNFDGELKLRQGDKREFFDIEIEVEKARVVEEDVDVVSDDVILEERVEVISLSGDFVEEENFVYVSKDARVVDWLPYGFALFLILIIVILVWERF
ncbi:hypothetical protein HN935_01915 [archaeon]|jgi:hypothetical protein|nr:hypothetical protein [archaeon]